MEKLTSAKNSRCILAEALVDESKPIFLNIYALNDQTQQVKFLRDLSTSVLNEVVNEKVFGLVEILNVSLNDIDKRPKRGGHSFEIKTVVIKKLMS